MPRRNLDKRLVIKEAAALVNEIGFSNLSLRLLAERLNIKPPSLYNHITNLEELKQELMIYGWEEPSRQLTKALTDECGDEAIRLVCRTFYDFAVCNPGVFEAIAFCTTDDKKMSTNASDEFLVVLLKALETRNITEENACHIRRLVRSYIEGFALLVNHKTFNVAPVPLKDSFDFGVELIINAVHALDAGSG